MYLRIIENDYLINDCKYVANMCINVNICTEKLKKKHSAVKYSFYHQKSQPDEKTKTAGLISVHISADTLAQIALKTRF